MPRFLPSPGSLPAGLLLAILLGCACNTLEGGAYRRQVLDRDAITDRAILSPRWKRALRTHGIFTYEPEESGGIGASHHGRRIYVGTGDGRLRCLDATTGAVRWEVALPGGVSAEPHAVEPRGLLYVGANDGALYALELDTGKPRWRHATKGVILQAPVYADETVFFANDRDQVFSLDAATGRWRWSYDRETPEGFTVAGHGRPLFHEGNLYVGFSDGRLVCLGARGGDVRWSRSLTGGAKEYVDVDATPVLAGRVLYASSHAGGVFALTPDGGALQWRYPVAGASTVAATSDRIYFASAREGIHALDREGRMRWRQRISAGSPGTPLVVERALIVPYAVGGLFVVDRLTGRLIQRFNPGNGISGPLRATPDSLFALFNVGELYAFTLR